MNPLNHVAIIMDGNGRWGLKHKNSRNAGHKAGLNTVEKIIKETLKNKVKFLRCLTNKKYRLKNKKVFLEGRRLVDEALNSLVDFETIWLTKSAFENSMNAELINKIRTKKILLDEISNIDLHDLSDTENSQGIIAEIDINKFITSSLDDIANDNLLILDGISDPGNLGAILLLFLCHF